MEGGLRKKVHKKEGWSIKGQIAKKKCKINRVGTLTGRWRVDCEKSAKLRGLGIKGRIAKKVQN